MSEPAMPTMTSVMTPPGTAPGTSQRASRPTMKPKTMKTRIVQSMRWTSTLVFKALSCAVRPQCGHRDADCVELVHVQAMAEELVDKSRSAAAHDAQERVAPRALRVRDEVPGQEAHDEACSAFGRHCIEFLPQRRRAKHANLANRGLFSARLSGAGGGVGR